MEERYRVDPVKRALELRRALKQGENILVVDLTDTLQSVDAAWILELMPNVRTGEYVFRSKVNVKEIDPFGASPRHPFVDIRQMSPSEIKDFVKRADFDCPLWFEHTKGFEMKRIADYNPDFIVQLAGCNFHDGTETGGCLYCYVDNKSNDGKPGKGKTLLNVEDTIESMLKARDELAKKYKKEGFDMNLKVLRFSGGEATIALDFLLALCRKSEKMGLDFVFSFDTNLSTGSLIDKWEREGVYEKNILEKLADYDVKVLGAIKGVCEENLQANVQSLATMEEQFYTIKKMKKAGLDIFFQVYNPHVPSLPFYFEVMDSHFKNFALKTHIGKLNTIFGPTQQRLTYEALRLGREPKEFIAEKQVEYDNNCHDGKAVTHEYLHKNYGVGYADIPRSDVDVEILKE